MAEEQNEEKKMMEEKSEPKSGSSNKGMAYVAYIIFFIPLLTDAKDDPFVKYHVKQGLALFILGIILSVISIIPILGWIVWFLGLIFMFIVWIMGLMNVSKGVKKPLPLIGTFGEKFSF